MVRVNNCCRPTGHFLVSSPYLTSMKSFVVGLSPQETPLFRNATWNQLGNRTRGRAFTDIRIRKCVGSRPVAAATAADTTQHGSQSSSGDHHTSPESIIHTVDFLVLGSGIAGLSYALKVAEHGSVAVVTKGPIDEGCTRYAQGGVCAVLDAQDSVEAHVRDTMIAGAFLNDPAAVQIVCQEGPARVLELAEKFGAKFTRSNETGELHLTREGGHSSRRIVHAADATGAEIERALVAAVRSHPHITVYEGHLAIDFVLNQEEGGEAVAPTVLGADTLRLSDSHVVRFVAPATMLATGGAGQVYPVTTNPSVATGDGVAMAARAKAAVADMEFVQFHPTAMYNPKTVPPGKNGRAFLISEALRGEGARLFTEGGHRFMHRYDDRGELAPRDIVARAIYTEMSNKQSDYVLLDISHKPAALVLDHFPNIAAHCATMGIDVTKEPIPVLPAQHYMCGGVKTGYDGQTSLPGLFACGEVACSGLHGANRLASNSLLEGLVFGHRAAQAAVDHASKELSSRPGLVRAAAVTSAAAASASQSSSHLDRTNGKSWCRSSSVLSPNAEWIADKRRQLTGIMMDAAGIVRHHAKMKSALQTVSDMYLEVIALCETHRMSMDLIELRNLTTVGELILSSALRRRESVGGHYCLDFPEVSKTAGIVGAPSRKAGMPSVRVGVPHRSGRQSGYYKTKPGPRLGNWRESMQQHQTYNKKGGKSVSLTPRSNVEE